MWPLGGTTRRVGLRNRCPSDVRVEVSQGLPKLGRKVALAYTQSLSLCRLRSWEFDPPCAHHFGMMYPMSYANPDEQREYVRQWMAKRRAAFFAGKSCVDCGSTEQLEIDHVDPTQKVAHRIWSWRKDRRELELAKCVVRCRSCHRIKTNRDNGWNRHGLNGYEYWHCRCVVCRAANAANQRRKRERRKRELAER
jgi:hypothetical protein